MTATDAYGNDVQKHRRRKTQGATRLELAERVSKIIGFVMIPLVLAVCGYWIQLRLQSQAIDRDFVALAINVLQAPETSEELRAWAVQVVNLYSEVKIASALKTELISGLSSLPVKGSCGNGEREGDEECDDGDRSNSDACLTNCRSATCGDGFVWSGHESCDDGNSFDGDECKNDCSGSGRR